MVSGLTQHNTQRFAVMPCEVELHDYREDASLCGQRTRLINPIVREHKLISSRLQHSHQVGLLVFPAFCDLPEEGLRPEVLDVPFWVKDLQRIQAKCNRCTKFS